MTEITVMTGETLLISGPASFRLIEGDASIFGALLPEGEKIVVRKEKQLPVEALSESILDLSLGEEATCVKVQGSTIPNSWREAKEAALEAGKGKIMVVGDVDTGKSAFCAFLTNSMISEKLKVAIVDADIGQSDIGPPTTIGLSVVKNYLINLSSATANALFFVGCISPSPVVEKVILGVKKLLNLPSISSLPAVINTDGWVADEGAVAYKVKMINEISPDVVIGIERGGEVDPILDLVKGISIRVESPSFLKRRSREDRKRLREYKYRKYLEGSKSVYLPLDQIEVRGLNVEELVNPPGLAEKQNLILGLLDSDNLLLGIGILKDFNPEKRALKVYTPIQEGVFAAEVGAVKITEEGKELAYVGESYSAI
jgi:polynucleotide 5'-hydroxyl-kinase GRC3/NOL9